MADSRRPGVETTKAVIDSPNVDQFMISANTFSTKDALIQISNNERVGLLERFVFFHGIEIDISNAEISRYCPQAALVALAADNA